MNANTIKDRKTTNQPTARRLRGLALAATVLLWLAGSAAIAQDFGNNQGDQGSVNRYRQVNLVSDLPDVAILQDTNLVNAWGIAFSATGPFWVSANGSGRAVIYTVTNDTAGMTHVVKQSLEVAIPGDGSVTGQVFNNTDGFHTNLFLFVSEDGTISGWRPALGFAAETLLTRTGAVYKGVALVTTSNGPTLLAANFGEGTVDAYDADSNLIKQYHDPHAPDGYAPFNIHRAAGLVFITFAKQDAAKHDDDPGPGHGLIDVFNPETGRFHRFASGTDAGGRNREINSPWGIALAPRGFGGSGDRLLVGNFGSGTIMAFDADGEFDGLLRGLDGRPIMIDGLWGLTFGNGHNAGRPGTLYFTAGPGSEGHGLFGSLRPARHLQDQDQGQNFGGH